MLPLRRVLRPLQTATCYNKPEVEAIDMNVLRPLQTATCYNSRIWSIIKEHVLRPLQTATCYNYLRRSKQA